MLKKWLVLGSVLSVGLVACGDEESDADILRDFGERTVVLCEDSLEACKNQVGSSTGVAFCDDLSAQFTAASENIENSSADRRCVKAMAKNVKCLQELKECEDLDAWFEDEPSAPCQATAIEEDVVCRGIDWYSALR